MKITISHHDPEILSAVQAALLSLDILERGDISDDHQSEKTALNLVIHGADGEELSAKFYVAPVRLGRLLDDVSMIVSGERAAPRLTIGGYILDVAQNRLKLHDAAIRLTDRESDILVYLYNHAPRVIDRQELLQNIWQYVEGVETHTLETHIYRLRQKIAEHDGDELLITDDNGYRLSL